MASFRPGRGPGRGPAARRTSLAAANKTSYWVGGTGNWSDAANHWAPVSGGVPGAAYLPDATTNVVFDAASAAAAYTMTFDISATYRDFTVASVPSAGTLTLSGAGAQSISGNYTLLAGMSDSSTGTKTFVASAGIQTVRTNAVSTASSITLNCAGATVQLADDLLIRGASANMTLTAGSFDANGKGVAFTGGGTPSVTGAFTFFNLTRVGTAVKTDSFRIDSNISVIGTLTVSGNSVTNRVLMLSVTLGSPRTVTAAAVALSNTDFQDISGAGAASPFTGTSMGDCLGNTGITFDASTTQFFKSTGASTFLWSDATKWFLGTGGTGGAGRVPLPQDDVTFDSGSFNANGATIRLDMPRAGRTLTFTGVTNSPTLDTNAASSIFGSLTLASGMTNTSAVALQMAARSAVTINTAGVTLTSTLNWNGPGGTFTLQSDLTIVGTGSTCTLFMGTLDANGFNVTMAARFTNQAASGTLLKMGSGTWTFTGTGSGNEIWRWSAPASSLQSGTSTIKGTDSTSGTKIFTGGGCTYYNLWFSGTGAGPFQITGANTFNDVKIDKGLVLQGAGGVTQTLTTFTASGAAPSGDVRFGQVLGTSGGYFSTPDSVTNSITSDIDVRVKLGPGPTSTTRTPIGKWLGGATTNEWKLQISATNFPSLQWNESSVLLRSASSTLTLDTTALAAAGLWLRATLLCNNGSGGCDVKFYTSSDYDPSTEAGTWTQLGATVTQAFTTSIQATTTALAIGAEQTGTQGVMTCRIFRARVYSGIAGTLVSDFNPADYVTAATWPSVSVSAETWTINGNALISATNRVGLTSSTNGAFTMAKTGGGKVKCDYLALRLSTVTPSPFTWYAGNNSLDEGSNTGWSFYSPDYALTADAGSYTLTGKAANELCGRRLTAAAGAYALTGVAANELCTRLLVASAGSYALTGKAANELYGRRLAAAAGAYALTGIAARLLRGYALPANAGVYALTGVADRLLRAYIMPGSPGAYVYTGISATFISTRPVTAFASDGVWIVSRRGTHWRAIARPTTWYVPRRPQRLNG